MTEASKDTPAPQTGQGMCSIDDPCCNWTSSAGNIVTQRLATHSLEDRAHGSLHTASGMFRHWYAPPAKWSPPRQCSCRSERIRDPCVFAGAHAPVCTQSQDGCVTVVPSGHGMDHVRRRV